jgi:tetratricopeptide (TPR) repeat protein
MATAEYVLRMGENSPVPAADIPKTAMPDWRRWNNYGIALMDQKQYPLAIDAFIHAAALDEKYRATAQVNQAIGLIELDQFDRAATLLEAVVRANPENMRALFQQARVFIRRGQLDEAEANLRRVLAVYPRDRLSLQQLGELCKIKHDYQVARECYEKILAIDPEDLGAHYNLMLLFRKLGMKDEAKREGKIFAELKDDPGALPLANMFLRKHPEMSNESVYWHIHDLAPAGQ